MARFEAPVIQDNPTGWGPCALPDVFKDMPYQPFAKGDRLGKVADWTGATYQDRRYTNKYSSQFGQGSSQYAYFHEEDESTFHLVDSSKQQKPLFQRQRKFQQQQRNWRRQQQQKEKTNVNMQILTKSQKNRERDRLRQVRKWQKQYGNRIEQKNQVAIKNRDASIQVKDTWAVIEEMDFPRLSKLSLPTVSEAEDIVKCGSLEFYDKTYDRVNTKTEKRLKRINRVFHKVTTTDDPIIRQLTKSSGNVFATDSILATLMCATRSVYSWDILVERVGNKLFFDKRDESNFDLLTVSETAQEPPQDEGNSINSPHNLALEATFINHNFSQQVLKPVEKTDDCFSFEKPNPFVQGNEDNETSSVAYRYRKWDLGNKITLVARCEHDAVMIGPNGENQFINIKTLNEWDSKLAHGVDWRQKLDSQRGAVVATELKNNSNKLAKWTVSSLLAGSDQIKFGYVSRASPKDSTKHVILGMNQFKPSEFANQINLNLDNAWGILRCIIDTCMKLKEGKYLIMKDPNKPVIRIYDIPDDTFDSDNDDFDEEDDEDEEEDSDDDDDDDDGDDEKDEEETKDKDEKPKSPEKKQEE
jgi:translation initiation factor 3 subunit D